MALSSSQENISCFGNICIGTRLYCEHMLYSLLTERAWETHLGAHGSRAVMTPAGCTPIPTRAASKTAQDTPLPMSLLADIDGNRMPRRQATHKLHHPTDTYPSDGPLRIGLSQGQLAERCKQLKFLLRSHYYSTKNISSSPGIHA